MKYNLIIYLLIALVSCSFAQEPAKVKRISPEQFLKQYSPEKHILVDVRTPEEYEAGHLTDAVLADYSGGEFEKKYENWDKSKTYFLYCGSGRRSGEATKILIEAGFKHVYNIGGYQDLKDAGAPVTK